MSQLLVQQYLNDLSDLRRASGTTREGVVSEAFKDLLKGYAKSHDLIFLNQYELPRQDGNRRIIDGALVYDVRVPFGYWEAKDEEDDLDKEIAAKLRRGYPRDNIIFEDSKNAVLIQHGIEVTRCPVDDTDKLPHLLDLFFRYERPEIADFRKAIAQFQTDLPEVLKALRAMIEKAQKENGAFRKGAIKFLKHAQETINPAVTAEDVREMLIQHVLTEEIFSKVFDEDDFHRQNNVAKELYALEGLFFTGALKKNTLKGLEPYYNAIRTTAHQIATHTEKQTFLKVIYEGFYKVYNKKAADRLGVVYTPNEVVRFMVESADWLCRKHFSKSLVEKGVEILDPATGTGTFICELMEHFRGQKQKLAWKYKEELHANEVAILPYYVANLNIEATYAAITGQYAEFPNLCFVDTLDNVAGLGIYSGHQHQLFGGVSDENVERIKRQNTKRISVIIGNPPYNAWQENYNARNPNRPYKRVDERIHDTFAKEGTAQNQSSIYDMYVRFFRWASDRLKDDGIVAFITNRNYIEKAAFDGFRKLAEIDFVDIWLVDLGGDVRANSKLSGTKNNVFGIQTGVAISFFIKRKGQGGATIHYSRRPEMATAEEKLDFLSTAKISEINFEDIQPDAKHNWINLTDNDWDTLLPIADKKGNPTQSASQDRALFRLMSNGLQTKRDDWVYEFDRRKLNPKMKALIGGYERARLNPASVSSNEIKWDRELTRHLVRKTRITFQEDKIVSSDYRPFTSKYVYFDRLLNSQSFQLHKMYRGSDVNPTITFLSVSSANPLACLAVSGLFDTCLLKMGNGSTQGLPRHRLSKSDERLDNVTDWGAQQFSNYYRKDAGSKGRPITKDAIFCYVYAVLHDPLYREKYAENLKREFPRIPFYGDFWKWAEWGEKLMALHIGYQTVKPWKLKRVDVPDEKSKKANLSPKPSLKADKETGVIVLDTETQLMGVPPEAWTYKLGNRSALEWVLDQYKEKTPKDPTIRAKFNAYRFADHREKVIDLLMRVTRVSVETMEIVGAMKKDKR